MRRSDSDRLTALSRRWNCVYHFFGIRPGDISPGATGLFHDESQYNLIKKKHRALVRRYHSDRGGKEVNSVKFFLIQSAWKFVKSKYEPPIDITGDDEIDPQRERSEEDDEYNIPLAESEEDDFKMWDLSHRDINGGGTDVNVVATRWCDMFSDNDSSIQREDNQNKQGKDNRQENSDKEGAVPVAVGAGAVLPNPNPNPDTLDETLAQLGRYDVDRGGGGWCCINSVCAELARLGQPRERSALLKQVGECMHAKKNLIVESGLVDYGRHTRSQNTKMLRLAAHIKKKMNPTSTDPETWLTDLEICALSEVVQLPLFVLVKRTTKWKWAKYSGFAMKDMEEGNGMSAKRLTLDISTPVNPTMQDIGIISHQLVHFTQAMPVGAAADNYGEHIAEARKLIGDGNYGLRSEAVSVERFDYEHENFLSGERLSSRNRASRWFDLFAPPPPEPPPARPKKRFFSEAMLQYQLHLQRNSPATGTSAAGGGAPDDAAVPTPGDGEGAITPGGTDMFTVSNEARLASLEGDRKATLFGARLSHTAPFPDPSAAPSPSSTTTAELHNPTPSKKSKGTEKTPIEGSAATDPGGFIAEEGYFNKGGRDMVQLLGPAFQEVLRENWPVPIPLTPLFRQKISLSSELAPSVTHFLAVNMKSAANNTQKIRDVLAYQFCTTPETSMREGLDNTIACLCFCKVTGTKVQGYKVTNIVAAATVICGSGIASSESPIMDYLYVVPKFRNKGFARALVNFAMIMGVVHGSPYPKLYLVAEKFVRDSRRENLAWQIYTEKYAFKPKTFGSLPANVTRYIRHCNYAADDQGKDAYVTPLLREGLLVRSTESTMSRLACPHNASREKQLEKVMYVCCLPDKLFNDSLQDKGCLDRLNLGRRIKSHQKSDDCICWEGTVYRDGVYQIASRVFYFMQIACDNFNGLLPSRPSDPAEAVQQLGQMILELRNYVDAKYILPQRVFLQCVLDKWGGGAKPPVVALDDDNVSTSDKTTGGCSSDGGADRTSDKTTGGCSSDGGTDHTSNKTTGATKPPAPTSSLVSRACLERYKDTQEYKGVVFISKTTNKVRVVKRIQSKNKKESIFFAIQCVRGIDLNITEAAWAFDLFVYYLAEIHDLKSQKEVKKRLDEMWKCPPLYVMSDAEVPAEKIRAVIRLSAFNSNGNNPLNFPTPSSVKSAWVKEKELRKVELTRLGRRRKEQISKAVIAQLIQKW